MPKQRERPLLRLRKDVETPNGAVWSWFATEEEIHQIAYGEAWDPEHRLDVGDLIKVTTDHHRPMNLRVTERSCDLVKVRRT